MKGIVRQSALALLLCGAGTFAADQPAITVAAFEENIRSGMNLPVDVVFEYQGRDGKAMDREALIAEASTPGNGISIRKTNRTVILQLREVKLRAPGVDLTHLPSLDLKDLSGQRVRNADLAGRTTLINFYFAECGPCIKEVPALNVFRQNHPELHYLAITFDSHKVANKFVSERRFEWPIIANAQRFLDSAGVHGFPAYMLIAPDGRILGRQSGLGFRKEEAIPGLLSLETFITRHLPQQKPD